VRTRGRSVRTAIRLSEGLVLAFSTTVLGCADASAPDERRHVNRLLVPGTEEAAAVIVDLDRREIVRQIGPPLFSQGPALLIDNAATLITSGRVASGDVILAGFDTRSGAEKWQFVASRAQVPLRSNGTALGLFSMAAHPRRPELFAWRSDREGRLGIAVFDYKRQEVTDFYAPFSPRPGGIAFLAPSARYPDGALVAFGDDGPRDRSRPFLYFLTGSPLALGDSLVLSRPSQQVWQVEGSADGKALIVGTDAQILHVDVSTLSVTIQARRPNLGRFVQSPTDGRLFLTAPGASDLPSPDIVHVLSPALELTAIVDLRAIPNEQRPLGIGGSIVSKNGRWLYIVYGVPRDGPLYGPQLAGILVLDTVSWSVVDIVPLRTFGGTTPFLMP